MKRFGICEWSVPFEGEALFAWMQQQEIGNLSIGFEYDLCKEEKDRDAWCQKYRNWSDKYGVDLSILAVNTVCTYGMNRKEHEDLVKDIIETAVKTAVQVKAPAIHLPSFVNGEIHSRKELEQTIVILKHACRLGEQYQIQIGYECALNEEDLGHVLEEVHGDTFYMLYDNENVSLKGIDPLSIYTRYKKWYKHTHLKTASAENFVRPLEEETSFGGIRKVMEAMVQSGFEGWIIIESDYRRDDSGKLWESVFQKDKAFIKSVYGLA